MENALGQSLTDTKSNTFEVGEGLSAAQKQKVLSKEEQQKIKVRSYRSSETLSLITSIGGIKASNVA